MNKNFIKSLANNTYPVKYEVILTSAFLLVYGVLCITEMLSFKLWPQVVNIWNEGYEDLTFMGEPLLLRFYLVLPIFIISKIISIDYNYFFSAVVPLMLYFSALNITKVVCDIADEQAPTKKTMVFVFSCLVLFFISLLMNGRMIFAILGSSILLYIIYFWGRLRLSSIVIGSFAGLFLSSVSTGAFIVFALSFFAASTFHALTNPEKKNVVLFFYSIVFIILISPFLELFFFKNVNFYGGGIEGFIQMFSHGLGFIFFLDFDTRLLSSLIIILFIILLLGVFVRFEALRVFLILLSISLVGGLFGYSTMTMGIPPAIALISLSVIFFIRPVNKEYAL